MKLVTRAIKEIGLAPIAARHGIHPSAVIKWKQQGRLPRTDLAGLTNYAKTIEELSEGRYPAADLLDETRSEWKIHGKPSGRHKAA